MLVALAVVAAVLYYYFKVYLPRQAPKSAQLSSPFEGTGLSLNLEPTSKPSGGATPSGAIVDATAAASTLDVELTTTEAGDGKHATDHSVTGDYAPALQPVQIIYVIGQGQEAPPAYNEHPPTYSEFVEVAKPTL